MSFEQADESFHQCARWGLEARVRWPRVGRVRVADLLLEQLIPQAVQGLIELGADVKLAKHYGGILTERARTGRNGARWQIDTVTSLELRSEEHTSELQSRGHLVCRLLLEKKKPGRRLYGAPARPSTAT